MPELSQNSLSFQAVINTGEVRYGVQFWDWGTTGEIRLNLPASPSGQSVSIIQTIYKHAQLSPKILTLCGQSTRERVTLAGASGDSCDCPHWEPSSWGLHGQLWLSDSQRASVFSG